MPTLKHVPDDFAWGVPIPSRDYRGPVSTHIYVAVALLACVAAVRLLVKRGRASPNSATGPDAKHKSGGLSPGPAEEKVNQGLGANSGAWSGHQRRQANSARPFVPLRVVPGQLGPLGRPPAMDGSEGELGEDHYPWSALAASRGANTSSPKSRHGTPPGGGTGSVAVPRTTRRSRSPRTSSRASSGKRHSGGSDGIGGRAFNGKGKAPMAAGRGGYTDDEAQHVGLGHFAGVAASAQLEDGQFHSSAFRDTTFPGGEVSIPRHFSFSRPPPPPPLTPPMLSGAFFPFEERRPSYAASIPPALDTSFIHQPNPEYGASSSSADIPTSASPKSGTASFPRRRSYTKSIPIGIPIAEGSPSRDPQGWKAIPTNPFSPSSYPPTSPLLPPPPPGQFELPAPATPPSAPPEYKFVGGPGGPGVFLSQQEEIDLQGEIISVLDDAGHGWKRHTRVYGGGTCLACVAAAGQDGAMGGFYGDRVPLEDRR